MNEQKTKPKTAEDWGKEIYRFSGIPGQLVQIYTKMAGQYSHITEQYIKHRLVYAKFYKEWKEKGEQKRSDKLVEAMWLLSKDGEQWYRLKRELRAYEHMMQACKTSTYIANAEARNQH